MIAITNGSSRNIASFALRRWAQSTFVVAPRSPLPMVQRCFASKVSRRNTSNDSSPSESYSEYTTLYERDPERNIIPRAALGVSLFNTTYWTWYSLDFIPAVNASPLQDMHIDPTIGLAGVALGLLINSVTILYPMVNISKISLSPNDDHLRVHLFDLPLIRPSESYEDYPLGKLYLDTKSSEAQKIVNELGGNLAKFSGHLGIAVKNKNIPLLMEVRDPKEVPQYALLSQALFNPQDFALPPPTKKGNKKGNFKGKGKNKQRKTTRRR